MNNRPKVQVTSKVNESTKNNNEILSSIDPSWNNEEEGWKKSEKDFLVIEECLGSGAYGSVSLVRDVNSRIFYARKTINKSGLQGQQTIENLKREIRIQRKLSHPNILKLCYCYEDQNSVFLILEYGDLGSLYQLIRRRQRIPESDAYIYFSQTLKGLEYMHKTKVVHRDIKPENLLLTKPGVIKICDFGWATEMPNYSKAFCGTVEYMAPEMIQSQITDFKSDLWSLGVLLYEMVQGVTPFQGGDYLEKSHKIISRKELEYPYSISDECKSLIGKMLQHNMHHRLTLEQIKNHSWMLMQGQNRSGSVRSSSMLPVRSPYVSEITQPPYRIQAFLEKSSIKEWEAMKFRSQQFQFQKCKEQSQGKMYETQGFLAKAFTAFCCINR